VFGGDGLSLCSAETGRRDKTVGVKPLALHHVSINVTDAHAALRFYVDVLGLSARPDRPDLGPGYWLDAGGQQVHLIQGETPPSRGQHFALRVGNLDATIAELRERGVSISDASPVGTGRQAFLADPDGNLIELHQAAHAGGAKARSRPTA
jgi:catechol 2,3-dioxygenase-like lactoylglutathione lyase family enzyme